MHWRRAARRVALGSENISGARLYVLIGLLFIFAELIIFVSRFLIKARQ